MHEYKDNFVTLVITMAIIVAMGALGFVIGSFVLSPKPAAESKLSYKPKASYPNGPIKLSYWRTADGSEVFKPILERWNAIHPSVAIEVVNIPLAEYDKRLADALSSGNMPDMFMLRSDWLPRYKAIIKPSPQAIFTVDDYKKTFASILVKDLTDDEDVLAVSYGVPTLGLFYNTDKFASAGITSPPADWPALLDANSKLALKASNGLIRSGIALGTEKISNASSIMALLMMQNGAVMTDTPPTKATFELPTGPGYPSSAKALDFYTSFAKPGKSSYSWNDGFGDSTQAFALGKTAMMIDYPYRYLQLTKQAPNLKFKMAKVPQVNGDYPVNYSEYWAEAVSKTSGYSDIAWDFYNFATSYEIMNLYSAPTMKPASRLDLAKAQGQDSIIGPFAEQVASAQGYYKGNGATTDVAFISMISTALSGFDSAIAVRIASERVTESIVGSR